MKKHTAVVVDDQPVFRDVVRTIVRQYVEVVAETDDFDEAVALVGEHRPDMVLIDVHVHGENGFQLAARCVEKFPQLFVVMMSGFAEKTYEDVAAQFPRTVFVAKDELSEEKLLSYIRSEDSHDDVLKKRCSRN